MDQLFTHSGAPCLHPYTAIHTNTPVRVRRNQYEINWWYFLNVILKYSCVINHIKSSLGTVHHK